jgi:hypothetical protein
MDWKKKLDYLFPLNSSRTRPQFPQIYDFVRKILSGSLNNIKKILHFVVHATLVSFFSPIRHLDVTCRKMFKELPEDS